MQRIHQSYNIRMSAVFKILLFPAIYKMLANFPLFLRQIKLVKGILRISLILTVFLITGIIL